MSIEMTARGALAHLMGLDRPRSLYLLVDHEPADQCGVLRWIAGRLRVPEPPRVPAEQGKPARGTKRCRKRPVGGLGLYVSLSDFQGRV